MSGELQDVERTIQELQKSSKSSLLMVLLGAICLVASLIYSATRLSPLEEEIRSKTHLIQELEVTEREIQNKIEQANQQYQVLKSNIEDMYATSVTADNGVLELKATAKATGQMTEHGLAYDFTVFINAPESTLASVAKVTYRWSKPDGAVETKTSTDSGSLFKANYQGWKCLKSVETIIEFTDRKQQTMEFDVCRSLGPLWWKDET